MISFDKKIDNIPVVILAGGKSSRMGRDKLMLRYGNETMLRHAVSVFSERFEKVYLSVSDEEKYSHLHDPKRDLFEREVIPDIYKDHGPISGLHTALSKIENDSNYKGVFLVAADMPYVDPDIALMLIDKSDDCDVCVPKDVEGRYEPLFAYYSKSVFPFVKKNIEAGINKVIDFYPDVNVRYVNVEELFRLSPENKELLYNINYPEDYEKFLSKISFKEKKLCQKSS
jgi:molybdopterin-guanine dinucleotide biosynthesis protein A